MPGTIVMLEEVIDDLQSQLRDSRAQHRKDLEDIEKMSTKAEGILKEEDFMNKLNLWCKLALEMRESAKEKLSTLSNTEEHGPAPKEQVPVREEIMGPMLHIMKANIQRYKSMFAYNYHADEYSDEVWEEFRKWQKETTFSEQDKEWVDNRMKYLNNRY